MLLKPAEREQRDQVAHVEGVGGGVEAAIKRGGTFGETLGQRVAVGAVGVQAAPFKFGQDVVRVPHGCARTQETHGSRQGEIWPRRPDLTAELMMPAANLVSVGIPA